MIHTIDGPVLLRGVLLISAALAVLTLATAALTGVHRLNGRQRRQSDYRLRGQLRKALLATSEPGMSRETATPRVLRRATLTRRRRRVLLEAAASIASAAGPERVRLLAVVVDGLGLTRRLQRELVGGGPLARAEAAERIGQLRLRSAKADLFIAMRDERMTVRVAAAYAYRLAFPLDCSTALVRMLQAEPTASGQQRLAEIIAGMRVTAARPLLDAAGEAPSPLLVRLVAMCAMPYDALPVLIDAADTLDPATRLAAVRALGTIGSTWAVPTLIEAVQDTDAFVRSAAVTALAATNDPSVLPHVLPSLGDADHVVRTRAAAAAAALSGGVAVASRLVTGSDDPAVRHAAAAAVQSHLVHGGVLALASDDAEQRSAAEQSVLALLTGPGYRRLARQLADRHPHPAVREAVGHLLELAESDTADEEDDDPTPQRRVSDRVVLEGARGPAAPLPTQRRQVRAARRARS